MSLENRINSTDQNISNVVTKSNDVDIANQANSNRDPISGELGAHPLGTGVGAAGAGTVATIAGGLVGGPVGAVVGALVGAVAGGLTGKDVAEQINPTVEDNHWRQTYSSRPYFEQGTTYADYQTAYRTGYEGFDRYGHNGRNYSDIESNLQSDYESDQTGSLTWEKARHAVRDAWDRAASAYRS